MKNISVVINTFNEEKNIKRAIDSVMSFADEIVVVDMKSTDDTQKIASELGAKIYEHERTGYVEPARNFAISKAKSEWILILDADEKIPKSLAKMLPEISKDPKADYYRIPRRNIVFGKWLKHSRWWPDHNIRFFRKGNVSWNEVIHLVPMTRGTGADLDGKKENAIIHFHYENIEQFVDRLNRYTSHHSKLLAKSGYVFDWKDLIQKPSQEFFSRFFFGKGYKDGLHGLAMSGLQAFSEFVLYLKLWQQKDFKKQHLDVKKVIDQMKVMQKDLNYWQSVAMYSETGSMIYRIKRKLKLL